MVNTPSFMGLRARILKAGIWTVAGHVVETLVRLGTSLVMTRLLVPGDFGLMAIALTIPASLAMLSDLGIQSSIIRKSGRLGSDFLRTAWTIQVLRGLLLSVLLLFISGLFLLPQVRQLMPEGSLLLHPQLPYLLAAMGAIPAISGLESVNIHVQVRDIHFGPLVLRTIISKIIPVPVMVIWALFYPSVWSLVAGALVAQTILALSSHIMIPGGPMKFSLDRQLAGNLFGDGKWIALSSAGTFFVTQSDRLILATLLTATQMGFYAIAWTLVEVARSFLQRLHGQVTLPILSELFRTRPSTAIDSYYKYRKPIDAFTFTAVGLLLMAAPEIVEFLFDDRYIGAGWIFQVLSLSLVPFPYLMISLCFIANDEWRGFATNSAIITTSFFIAVFIGYCFSGWIGVVWGVALYTWPATLIILIRAYRRGWVDPFREIVMLPFLLLGLILGFPAKLFLQWMGTLL